MIFLLDTNVISELRKAGDGRADANVVAWLEQEDASSLFISVITLLEREIGILRAERRDTRQGAQLRSCMDTRVLPEFADRTLPIDTSIALNCARLHVSDPLAERDALNAATALTHGPHPVAHVSKGSRI